MRLRAVSFLLEKSMIIGLAKVDAAAKTIRLISDQRPGQTVMMLQTESQEGGKDTGELHRNCCGGFARR